MITFTARELQLATECVAAGSIRLHTLYGKPGHSSAKDDALELSSLAEKLLAAKGEVVENDGTPNAEVYRLFPFTVSGEPTGYRIVNAEDGTVLKQFIFDRYINGDRDRALRDAQTLYRLMNQTA